VADELQNTTGLVPSPKVGEFLAEQPGLVAILEVANSLVEHPGDKTTHSIFLLIRSGVRMRHETYRGSR
jgi:hypothetical protein